MLFPREIIRPRYDTLSQPQSGGRQGGGVDLVYNSSIEVHNITQGYQQGGFEYMNVHVIFRNKTFTLFTDILIQVSYNSSNLWQFFWKKIFYLTGDFNIQMDKPHLSDTILFNDFLDTFNLTNKVMFSTHLSQHIIDLMLVKNQSMIGSGMKQGYLFSDHHFIHAELSITIPKPRERLVSYRKLKNICDTELAEDLRTTSLQGNTVEDLVTSYNLNFREILGKHAPLKECRLHPCHLQPWFMDKIKDEIRVRHMKEHKWKNDPTEYNLNVFYQQRRYVANSIKHAQQSFYI